MIRVTSIRKTGLGYRNHITSPLPITVQPTSIHGPEFSATEVARAKEGGNSFKK